MLERRTVAFRISVWGTTIEALMHLDRMAVRAAVIDAVTASCERSRELGAK